MKRETDLGLPKTPSRGGKPIKIFQKCQNEAGNGVKSPKNAFPRREMGEIFRKTVLCDGKPIKFLGKRSCAAGRRLKFSEIVFVRREMGLFFRKTFSAADLLSVPFINLTHTIRYRPKNLRPKSAISEAVRTLFRRIISQTASQSVATRRCVYRDEMMQACARGIRLYRNAADY